MLTGFRFCQNSTSTLWKEPRKSSNFHLEPKMDKSSEIYRSGRTLSWMALNPSGFMEVVGVPASIMLGAMLKELNLPSPKYESHSFGGACFETRVLFYPSMQFLQNSAHPHSILGYLGDTMEEATNIAATQAIKYMKNNKNKVLKDYSYDELQKEKKVNRALGRQMEVKNLKLHHTNIRLTKTFEAYNNYMNTVRNATKSIQKMISDHARDGTNLLDIQAMVDDLNQQTHQANAHLNTEGEIPYYGPDEDKLSTGHYESEDEDAINWNTVRSTTTIPMDVP